MIKPAPIIKLLKQRLAHNKTWLEQDDSTRFVALKLSYGGEVTEDMVEGHRRAVIEENEFLRAVLEESK